LGAFAKLLKATISFFMSVRLAVRMKHLGSHWTISHENLYLSICRKSVGRIKLHYNPTAKKGHFTL